MTQEQLSETASCRLVSFPMVDVAELPLHLPFPNEYNAGGYLVPSPSGSVYQYSPIDLLVAGIEASWTGEVVTNLCDWFYKNQHPTSTHMIHIILKLDNKIVSASLAELKDTKISCIQKVMLTNAPLTFKRFL